MPATPERSGAAPAAGPEQPARDLAEISAEHEATVAEAAAEHAEAEAQDDRCAVIGECLMALYADGDPDIAAKLEPYIEGGQFPEAAAAALAVYEAEKQERRPEFDITAISPKRILRSLSKALEAQAEEAEITEMEEQAEAKQGVAVHEEAETAEAIDNQQEAVAEDDVAADEEVEEAAEKSEAERYTELLARHQDKQGLDLLAVIESAEGVAEVHRERAATFCRIHALVQTEGDAAIIEAKIGSLDFSSEVSDPLDFLRTEIFSSSEADTGVSEATQNAIAEAFDLPRQRVATGEDLHGAATATVIRAPNRTGW